ncbi:hypothetical protein H7Y40_01435 [Pedobacter sp.]|nr:hypothetical protein [Candidatus Saccharibacteria bacterium]
MAPFFVLIPLAFFLPMFAYETYIAFRRIGKPLDKGGEYLHATWETTHTFLILTVNYFIWLYSAAVVEVGQAVFLALLLFGAAFIVRAILYIQLFYIKSSKKPSLVTDRLFAWMHIIILACLGYTVLTTLMIMLETNYPVNDTFMPLLWPGLILMIPLISVPLYTLYRTKSR